MLVTTPAASELHSNLQSVDARGTSVWQENFPFTLTGILLNNPEEMLDATAHFVPWNDGEGLYQMGGQWQVFIQSTDPEDRGGTALWMGQNYGNLPFLHNSDFSYANEAWRAEMERLNHDPDSGHRFRRGDQVEVTARRSLFYGGKRNINEAHDAAPENDFELRWLAASPGSPEPERITLADLVRPDDGNPDTPEDIFDATRATGGEHYQSMRVRLEGVTFWDDSGWEGVSWNDRVCVISDGNDRFLPVRLSLTLPPQNPEGPCDIVGILDQDSGSGSDGTFGYYLFAQEIAPHPSLPTLACVRQGAALVLRWNTTDEWTLESRPDLVAGTWQPVEAAVETSGTDHETRVASSGSRGYFRLNRVLTTP